jgi:peptide deformylase
MTEPTALWTPDEARGTVRPVRQLGDPVLRSVATPVTRFDDDLKALLDDMFASMYAAEGVGLAANQIGVEYDVFVYDCPFDEDDDNDPDLPPEHGVGYVVNPTLTRTWGEQLVWSEGCLSLVGFSWDTPRDDCATVTGVDVDGRPVEVSGSGILGRCLQHEADHLRGKVYLDRLPRLQRGKAMRRFLEHQESYQG